MSAGSSVSIVKGSTFGSAVENVTKEGEDASKVYAAGGKERQSGEGVIVG